MGLKHANEAPNVYHSPLLKFRARDESSKSHELFSHGHAEQQTWALGQRELKIRNAEREFLSTPGLAI